MVTGSHLAVDMNEFSFYLNHIFAYLMLALKTMLLSDLVILAA
uniref:Uncharacterized protein n=1 Tax=Arundo donax TaxID=35708 RepID=A0A0A8ZJW4_ARUDO